MKIDLKKDRAKLRKYIEKRIRDYSVYENLGPGEDDAPIALITLGYYAAQGGYANLVFDTRPDADIDGEWTQYIAEETNTCPFPKWYAACMSIYDGKPVVVTETDGNVATVTDEMQLQLLLGNMLVGLLTELRSDGTLALLPLTQDAYMTVQEFDFTFFWPEDDAETIGRVNGQGK